MSTGIQTDLFQLKQAITLFPHHYVYKLYKIEQGRNLTNCEVIYLNFSEFGKTDLTIITFENAYYHAGTFHIDKNQSELVYSVLSRQISLQNLYFHEQLPHVTLAQNSDPTSYLLNIPNAFFVSGAPASLAVTVFHSSKVNISSPTNILSMKIAGEWQGIITFRKIVGANFLFPYNNIIVSPETMLAQDIRQLYEQRETEKIATLIHKITLTANGYVDKDIAKYL